jgi:hypothetical protein
VPRYGCNVAVCRRARASASPEGHDRRFASRILRKLILVTAASPTRDESARLPPTSGLQHLVAALEGGRKTGPIVPLGHGASRDVLARRSVKFRLAKVRSGIEYLWHACAGCTVEVFSDDDAEGRLFEGATVSDPSGAFAFTKAPNYLVGPNVTATATDTAGNTSEFSEPKRLPGRPVRRHLPRTRPGPTPRSPSRHDAPKRCQKKCQVRI